jgi:hypothetical protein
MSLWSNRTKSFGFSRTNVNLKHRRFVAHLSREKVEQNWSLGLKDPMNAEPEFFLEKIWSTKIKVCFNKWGWVSNGLRKNYHRDGLTVILNHAFWFNNN